MPAARVNGISINYETSGRGFPLLLITGFASDLNTWAFQVPAFSKSFLVIRLDNRGVGRSDKPEGPYSIQQMAQDAIGLLDRLRVGKAHLVGHSMGGAIAQEIAINHPERVAKLILCSTFADPDDLQATGNGSIEAGAGAIDLMREIIYLSFNRPIFRWPAVLLSKIFAPTVSPVGIEGQRAACWLHEAVTRLHLIQAPTLVVVGTGDRLIRPASSESIAMRIPGASLAKIEGGSHVLNIERRKEFNKIVLSFLLRSAGGMKGGSF